MIMCHALYLFLLKLQSMNSELRVYKYYWFSIYFCRNHMHSAKLNYHNIIAPSGTCHFIKWD
jgi:hypothetical protein